MLSIPYFVFSTLNIIVGLGTCLLLGCIIIFGKDSF